jgi:hypothetical protein
MPFTALSLYMIALGCITLSATLGVFLVLWLQRRRPELYRTLAPADGRAGQAAFPLWRLLQRDLLGQLPGGMRVAAITAGLTFCAAWPPLGWIVFDFLRHGGA